MNGGELCTLGDCPKPKSWWDHAEDALTLTKSKLAGAKDVVGDAVVSFKETAVEAISQAGSSNVANKTVEMSGRVINATINITGNIVGGTASVAQGAQHTAEALQALARLTQKTVEFAEEYNIPQWCIGSYTVHFVGMRAFRLMMAGAGFVYAIRHPEPVLQIGWH